jgi:hypothetical protein
LLAVSGQVALVQNFIEARCSGHIFADIPSFNERIAL